MLWQKPPPLLGIWPLLRTTPRSLVGGAGIDGHSDFTASSIRRWRSDEKFPVARHCCSPRRRDRQPLPNVNSHPLGDPAPGEKLSRPTSPSTGRSWETPRSISVQASQVRRQFAMASPTAPAGSGPEPRRLRPMHQPKAAAVFKAVNSSTKPRSVAPRYEVSE